MAEEGGSELDGPERHQAETGAQQGRGGCQTEESRADLDPVEHLEALESGHHAARHSEGK
jgi:hypothetical protein